MMSRRTVLGILLIQLFGFSRASSCTGVIKDVETINKERAEVIISALYDYQQLNQTFPSSLTELTPDFLVEIPKPFLGGEFFYTTKVDGFILSFRVRSNYGCGYTDRFGQWECSFGGD